MLGRCRGELSACTPGKVQLQDEASPLLRAKGERKGEEKGTGRRDISIWRRRKRRRAGVRGEQDVVLGRDQGG